MKVVVEFEIFKENCEYYNFTPEEGICGKTGKKCSPFSCPFVNIVKVVDL